MLYSDGQLIGPYSGDRAYAPLSAYIEEQAIPYARGGSVPGQSSSQSEEIISSVTGRPNPEGKVLEVDEAGLATIEGNGPVMIEYYAPWCGQ
jgi:hypothetical protein